MKELTRGVIEVAKEAGAAILSVYNDEASFETELKDDKSPLTRADKLANEVIVEGLEKLPEIYPIISEENKQIAYDERKNFETFWLVDPLDGTKEFIKRNGEFTVNIALVKNGSPIMGVVYVPVSQDLYWAVKGEGAYYGSFDDAQRLLANEYKLTDSGLRVVCSRSHINQATQDFIDKLDAPEAVSKGSSLKFLLIASGKAEVYPRMGPTMEWDTGAAQIILEESGGSILQLETNEPLEYNKENLLNPYFIATGRQLA